MSGCTGLRQIEREEDETAFETSRCARCRAAGACVDQHHHACGRSQVRVLPHRRLVRAAELQLYLDGGMPCDATRPRRPLLTRSFPAGGWRRLCLPAERRTASRAKASPVMLI